MSIGYACLAIAVLGSEMKTCIQANATEKNLLSLIEHNLHALETLVDYNQANDIRLFRISSDLIPFGSSVAKDIPWMTIFANQWKAIGEKITRSGMRVSMHPGQYTVLNSPSPDVVTRAILDLQYHKCVLSSLGLDNKHKIVLHIGGVYGDKTEATKRFIETYQHLNEDIRQRLVLENDDRMYTISEVLTIAEQVGAPVIFDNLHHAVNPPDESQSEIDWIRRCSVTWGEKDGRQKIHYSQQNREKRPGAHTETIAIDTFMCFYDRLKGTDIDIMLEVKDKNMSAMKCINCTSYRSIRALEEEWGRYKYLILEKSPETYIAVRKLLHDKNEYPAREMYHMLDDALSIPFHAGHAVNAAEHVWGYFKNKATPTEKKRYQNLLRELARGEKAKFAMKRNLLSLSRKYKEDYLIQGYYFYL